MPVNHSLSIQSVGRRVDLRLTARHELAQVSILHAALTLLRERDHHVAVRVLEQHVALKVQEFGLAGLPDHAHQGVRDVLQEQYQ